ncbi:hypothetical protein D3C75_1167270 [compost metagenome]
MRYTQKGGNTYGKSEEAFSTAACIRDDLRPRCVLQEQRLQRAVHQLHKWKRYRRRNRHLQVRQDQLCRVRQQADEWTV